MPNTREKLIELIRMPVTIMPDAVVSPHITFTLPYAEYLADHLIANGVTVREWKPISEPPKEKGTYLVCTDNGGVLLGHWYGTAWNAGGGAKKHLAYWMKKPQPPKGE